MRARWLFALLVALGALAGGQRALYAVAVGRTWERPGSLHLHLHEGGFSALEVLWGCGGGALLTAVPGALLVLALYERRLRVEPLAPCATWALAGALCALLALLTPRGWGPKDAGLPLLFGATLGAMIGAVFAGVVPLVRGRPRDVDPISSSPPDWGWARPIALAIPLLVGAAGLAQYLARPPRWPLDSTGVALIKLLGAAACAGGLALLLLVAHRAARARVSRVTIGAGLMAGAVIKLAGLLGGPVFVFEASAAVMLRSLAALGYALALGLGLGLAIEVLRALLANTRAVGPARPPALPDFVPAFATAPVITLLAGYLVLSNWELRPRVIALIEAIRELHPLARTDTAAWLVLIGSAVAAVSLVTVGVAVWSGGAVRPTPRQRFAVLVGGFGLAVLGPPALSDLVR